MKNTTRLILVITYSFSISSCDLLIGREKLNLKKLENKEVIVEMYDISEITTVHQFIDITNKRWSKQERVLEANSDTVDSIYFKNDTLFLKLSTHQPMIYDLAAVKYGYKIVLAEREHE